MAKKKTQKRPLRWRHIPGTVWGHERWELFRGEFHFATVRPGKRDTGSSWFARCDARGSLVALKREEWAQRSISDAQAEAKAYVVEQLARGESDS